MSDEQVRQDQPQQEVEREVEDDRLLRLAADFDNYKKRAARERQEYVAFANERLVKELLPILDDLERALVADRSEGLHPWLLFTSAGTTNTGAIDPLAALGEITRREGVWLHVDGAYGGFFHLTERGRRAL